jgi:alpha-L-fucosidase
MVADVTARGGNLLLNIGPAGDGTIPLVQAERVLGLGWWLRTNGEAIFGTRPWTTPEGQTTEGLPVRFTTKGDDLFAIVFGTPSSNVVTLPDVSASTAELLGHGEPLTVNDTPAGIRVQLPSRPPTGPAITLRLSPVPVPAP